MKYSTVPRVTKTVGTVVVGVVNIRTYIYGDHELILAKPSLTIPTTCPITIIGR